MTRDGEGVTAVTVPTRSRPRRPERSFAAPVLALVMAAGLTVAAGLELSCADPYGDDDDATADDDDSATGDDDDSAASDDDDDSGAGDDDSATADDDDDDSVPQPLPWAPRIAADHLYSCAIDSVGALWCWGCDSPNAVAGQCEPPDGTYTQVGLGYQHGCALDTTGAAVCWGRMGDGFATGQPGPFVQLSVGWYHACGLAADGAVTCWGCQDPDDAIYPDTEVCEDDEDLPPMAQIASDDVHACGIGVDLAVTCWGNDLYGYFGELDEPLLQVSTANTYTCGIRASNQMPFCWGYHLEVDPPQGIAATQVAVDSQHGCILDSTGLPRCWYSGTGYNDYGQGEAVDEPLEQIALGNYHTCGLRADDSVVCWGGDQYGQCSVP